jgi:hypothetical protein
MDFHPSPHRVLGFCRAGEGSLRPRAALVVSADSFASQPRVRRLINLERRASFGTLEASVGDVRAQRLPELRK